MAIELTMHLMGTAKSKKDEADFSLECDRWFKEMSKKYAKRVKLTGTFTGSPTTGGRRLDAGK
jgi:hypothetical protein